MNKKVKIAVWILVSILAILAIAFCAYKFVLAKTENITHPEISFEIENYGNIKMELYPEYAPNTVANIIKLAEKGYYNDKVIYGKDSVCMYFGRNSDGEAVNPKASLIDSSIEADSDSDYEYTIEGEFVANNFKKNTLRHEKGVVSLLRNDYTQYFSNLSTQSYNSGNAQIGIIMNDSRNLNGVYAAFGKITEGMDILEKIYNEAPIKVEEPAEGETEQTQSSVEQFETYPVIKSATVNTFGYDYGMPKIEEAFDYNDYFNKMLTSYYTSSGQ